MRISDWSSDVCSSDLLRGDALVRLSCVENRAAGVLGREHGLIVLVLRRNPLGQQFLLARGLALGIAQLVLRGGQFGLALPVIGAQRGDARARAGDRGFGLVDGGLIRRRIDPEQHVAFLHPLIVAHLDRDHAAGNIGAYRYLARLQIGVVSRLVAAAMKVEGKPAEQQHERPEQQQRGAQAAARRAIRLGGTAFRSEEHTSELQSLMRNSYTVYSLKKK